MSAGGFLDTNLFVHAHTSDRHSAECRAFLLALEHERISAELHPLVLHELSYVLPRYLKGMTRAGVAQYLLAVLAWPGVTGEKETMVAAVERWRDTRSGLVDAYLLVRASADGRPVYTKNRKDFEGLGVEVPERLPGV